MVPTDMCSKTPMLQSPFWQLLKVCCAAVVLRSSLVTLQQQMTLSAFRPCEALEDSLLHFEEKSVNILAWQCVVS